jgi:predicted peptidase
MGRKVLARNVMLGVAFALALNWAIPAQVQSDDPAFQKKIYTGANGAQMPYRLHVPPNYNRKEKYPLVLWLHGAAGRGTDNVLQISAGNTLGTHIWTKPENQAKFPTFVLAPQCPPDQVWGRPLGPPQPPPALRLALEILREVRKAYSIDPARIYVAGQSMGGEGTWAALYYEPETFVAALPLCGYLDPKNAARVAHKPVWIFQGAADPVVDVAMARNFVAALKAAGGEPKYNEYPGVGHNVWEKAFAEPEVVTWLAKQKGAE